MIKMRLKFAFFDTAKVQRAVDRATRQALSKGGAFVRQRAKTSIRRRKKISEPGKPPSSHAGLLRQLIYFGFDFARTSVVIGPLPHRQGRAPELLEFGGRAVRKTHTGKPRVLTYRPRPFMGPALDAEVPNFPARWRNSVRRT